MALGAERDLKDLAVNQLLIVQETKGIVESREFR
jgi:hypothetical protein